MSRGWDFLKTTFENFTQPQKKNLARIIQECLVQNVRPYDTIVEAALSYTGGVMLSNMLQFYPQIEDEIQAKDKIDLIKKNLNWFRQDLYNGNIDIKTLMMFHKENERIPRFNGLVLDNQKLAKEIQVHSNIFSNRILAAEGASIASNLPLLNVCIWKKSPPCMKYKCCIKQLDFFKQLTDG